jgi:hypothetical protein
LLKFLVSGEGFLERRQLVLRDIAAHVLAVLPSLMVVVGTVGALAKEAEFATFHVLDLGDLLEEFLRGSRGDHAEVYSKLYIFCP